MATPISTKTFKTLTREDFDNGAIIDSISAALECRDKFRSLLIEIVKSRTAMLEIMVTELEMLNQSEAFDCEEF